MCQTESRNLWKCQVLELLDLDQKIMYIVYCKEIKGKLKCICKEWKTIKGDLAHLKETQMLLLEIKNPVLKLKPQWVDLAALIKCF